jgi:hypothetical protein
MELFVVTGLPGVNALRHVPFDEAAERMLPQLQALVKVAAEDGIGIRPTDALSMLMAALGEGT